MGKKEALKLCARVLKEILEDVALLVGIIASICTILRG